jgi:hypothetical protein
MDEFVGSWILEEIILELFLSKAYVMRKKGSQEIYLH